MHSTELTERSDDMTSLCGSSRDHSSYVFGLNNRKINHDCSLFDSLVQKIVSLTSPPCIVLEIAEIFYLQNIIILF